MAQIRQLDVLPARWRVVGVTAFRSRLPTPGGALARPAIAGRRIASGSAAATAVVVTGRRHPKGDNG